MSFFAEIRVWVVNINTVNGGLLMRNFDFYCVGRTAVETHEEERELNERIQDSTG